MYRIFLFLNLILLATKFAHTTGILYFIRVNKSYAYKSIFIKLRHQNSILENFVVMNNTTIYLRMI